MFIVCSIEWVQPNSAGPKETYHGIWSGASGQHPPALGARNLTHSNPVHQIFSHVFA